MPKSSRFIRPEQPQPIQLQLRDIAVLEALFEHRFLNILHLKDLAFPTAGLRTIRRRLRLLWENELVRRRFLPSILEDGRPNQHPIARFPLYSLALAGARIVADRRGLTVDSIPHTPSANRRGYENLKHHVRVTDFLVAAAVASKRCPDVVGVSLQRETALRQAVAAWKLDSGTRGPYIISDGAISIARTQGPILTFHIELVRSAVAGSNHQLVKKLQKYVRLYRQGFFERVFGHRHLRAVLIATTSEERADRLRTLADRMLVDGRHFFWFGAFDDRAILGWTPENVLGPIWRRTDGKVMSILPPTSPS
jgi:hypothetical protein